MADEFSEVVQSVETEHGVLDLHFSPRIKNLMCTANSTGSISVYRFNTQQDDSVSISTSPVQISVTDSSSILVLALQWHPEKENTMAVTLSNGDVLSISLHMEALNSTFEDALGQETKVLVNHTTIHSHELEAWTLAFTPLGRSVLTGGDDCVLQYSSLSLESGEENGTKATAQLIWSNRKLHNAGVTAILALSEKTFLTGSYDDHIRIIDATSGRPKIVTEFNLGGGVWRLSPLRRISKDIESDGEYEIIVLASCMHAGARIVRVIRDIGGNWLIEVLCRFEEHKSMNYGSDWVDDGNSKESRLIVSTSFYDKLVCLWRFSLA
jgi:diphthamide biosynthesis protein 7